MKMAIAIQCHANSNQINKLIEFFFDEDIDVYIHIDKKSNIKNEIIVKENVYFVDNNKDVQWGQFSQVEATLELFSKISDSNNKYDYIHLISGQDYPIKTIKEFKKFFSDNNKQYIRYTKLPTCNLSRMGKDRYEVYYPSWLIDRPSKHFKRYVRLFYREFILFTKIFKRKIDFIDDIYYGSQWFSITGECLTYILNYIKNNKKYVEFFKNSIYSDEMFFQTIIINSNFDWHIEDNNLRYIDWSEKQGSPKTLDVNDIDKALISNCFFARKIVDINVVNYIENVLKNMENRNEYIIHK